MNQAEFTKKLLEVMRLQLQLAKLHTAILAPPRKQITEAYLAEIEKIEDEVEELLDSLREVVNRLSFQRQWLRFRE